MLRKHYSAALRKCRRALEDAGFAWRLPNGDMIFVPPEYYRLTMQALKYDEVPFVTVYAT